MKKSAFTFIELLVVMSIIILLSGSGMMYFSRQVVSLKIENELSAIEDIVKDLDTRIVQKEILDYQIDFSLPKSEKGFNYTINTLGVDVLQNASFDSQGKTIMLSTNELTSGTQYNIDMYSGVKFYNSFLLDVTENFSQDVSNKTSYRFVPSFTGSIMNETQVYYYSSDYILDSVQPSLSLIGINAQSDGSGISYAHVQVISRGGKKEIIAVNEAISLSQVYLLFEKEGIEKYITIN